jgi:hypothetical protein
MRRASPSEANFHEKALLVKADVAALDRGRAQRPFVLSAMLPSALSVSPLFDDSVHYEIHLDSDYREGAAIFLAVSPFRGVDQVRMAQSPHARDPKRSDTGKPYVSL